MAELFLDSSAMVKRYVAEVGSTWLNQLTSPGLGNVIRLASITQVEVVSAIVRRRRGGSILPPDAAIMIAQWRHEIANEFFVLEVTSAAISLATDLAEKHELRGVDAVQLAMALEVQHQCKATHVPLTFIGADQELNSAAAAEGLTVDDPNDHP